jgi:hypothetical protein
MKALVLGDKSQAGIFFREANVEYVNEGPFDAVLLASHLQVLKRHQVPQALKTLYEELVDGGRIIITVPSLEWACRQVCTQNDIPISAYISIYGTESENYLCGFTMLWLRRAMEEVGFILLEARTETFRMNLTIGTDKLEDKAKQHVVIAIKRQPDPVLALEGWLK